MLDGDGMVCSKRRLKQTTTKMSCIELYTQYKWNFAFIWSACCASIIRIYTHTGVRTARQYVPEHNNRVRTYGRKARLTFKCMHINSKAGTHTDIGIMYRVLSTWRRAHWKEGGGGSNGGLCGFTIKKTVLHGRSCHTHHQPEYGARDINA